MFNFFLKTTDDMLLLFAESGDQKLLEKQGLGFFGLKIHFRPKTLRKHLEHLDKPIYGLKKQKKAQKTEVNPNLKTFPRSNLSPREMRKTKTLR